MSKYTKELKIKLVLEYLSWESGGQDKIPQSTLKNWILKYQSGGFDNLTKKQSNDKFTSEFKLSVIQSLMLRLEKPQSTLISSMDL